jgi:Fic family protein
MNNSLSHTVDNLAKELRNLLPMKEGYQRKLDNKFRLEFNYNSNHIEGNTLTYGETKLLLFLGNTSGEHTIREYDEMKAHDVAFTLIQEWAKDADHTLTERDIKELNEIILVQPFWKDAVMVGGQATRRLIKVGDYKEFPNHVRLENGEIFYYAEPIDTPIKMGELMNWYRNEVEKSELHPVEIAALYHYEFVRIHPFDDGNGRISRLLLNYILIRSGFPPVVIKSEDKKNYLQALRQADVGNIEAFVNYIGEQLLWSLRMSLKAARGEDIDEPGDLIKKIELLKRKLNPPILKTNIKKSPQSISQIFTQSLVPLAKAWDEILQHFDSIFYKRSVLGVLDGKNIVASDFSNIFSNKFWADLNQELNSSSGLVSQFSLQCIPRGIRALKKDVTIDGGKINIWFFENRYEVSSAEINYNIGKEYDEQLTENEIEKLVDGLGKYLYNVIESQTQKK